jgi:hypothetical protein
LVANQRHGFHTPGHWTRPLPQLGVVFDLRRRARPFAARLAPGEHGQIRAKGMIGLLEQDLDVGQSDVVETGQQIVPLHPVRMIVDAAAVLAVRQIRVVLQAEEIADESIQPDVRDSPEVRRLDMVRVVPGLIVVRPQKHAIRAPRDRLEQVQRVALMVEDAACHDQVEPFRGRLEKGHEVAELEGHPTQPCELLDDQALQI